MVGSGKFTFRAGPLPVGGGIARADTKENEAILRRALWRRTLDAIVASGNVFDLSKALQTR